MLYIIFWLCVSVIDSEGHNIDFSWKFLWLKKLKIIYPISEARGGVISKEFDIYGRDSPFVSDSCQKIRQNSYFLTITLILNISGQKWAIGKIPKPEIIYWEVATSLDYF